LGSAGNENFHFFSSKINNTAIIFPIATNYIQTQEIIPTFVMLLGVLGTIARLRLHPMNLICIMTAQGNGIGIHCYGFGQSRSLWVV
jgi:putative effector of murein hydrolase